MSKYAVEVKNVKKSFFLPHHKNNSLKTAITQVFKPREKGGKTFDALNDISFNVEKGDFFGILGRNGSGKSTLLKIISEIYQPTSGSVKHNGKVVSFIELGVGFKSELSGRENVYLNGALLGFSKQEVNDMYDEIVGFAELEDFMDQKLKNYSSGMKVRLAFSVAIRAKADILILDEVLAVGDAAFQKKCTDYFATLKNDGKTVILVTHSMGNVRQFCSKAVVIEGGKVIFSGDADYAADEYLKLFTPKENAQIITEEESVPQGSQLVTIDDITARVQDDYVTIHFTVSSKINTDVYIAVDVTRDGVLVGGVSSHKDETRQLKLSKGQSMDVSLDLQNIFGRGSYEVSIGVKNPLNHDVYDLHSNVTSFVITEAHSAYLPLIVPSTLKSFKK